MLRFLSPLQRYAEALTLLVFWSQRWNHHDGRTGGQWLSPSSAIWGYIQKATICKAIQPSPGTCMQHPDLGFQHKELWQVSAAHKSPVFWCSVGTLKHHSGSDSWRQGKLGPRLQNAWLQTVWGSWEWCMLVILALKAEAVYLLQIWGHPGLYSQFKGKLYYITRCCLNKRKTKREVFE